MDATFPGKVPLQRVNYNASLSYEITQNYKILQQVFARCHVQKNIDVDQLQRGTFQDNLEFLQWIKHYHDVNTVLHPGEYKARERRRQCGCAEPKGAPGKLGVKRPISTSLSASTAQGGAGGLAAKKGRTASSSVHVTTTTGRCRNSTALHTCVASAQVPSFAMVAASFTPTTMVPGATPSAAPASSLGGLICSRRNAASLVSIWLGSAAGAKSALVTAR